MTEILVAGSQQCGHYMNGPTQRNNSTDDMITDRCLKCGLKKHSTLDYRHKNQIQSRSCSFSGHKDYNCPKVRILLLVDLGTLLL